MSKVKKLPSQEYLNECFSYNKETGSLTWKKRPNHHFVSKHLQDSTNTRFESKEAGSVFVSRGQKRSMIWISGERFYKQRIIWKLVTGKDPLRDIDHEDTNTLNNVWSNLREADDHQNSCNRNKRKDNTSGYKGVQLRKESGRYRAIITAKGETIHLGHFGTKEEAAKAYMEANIKLHGEFSRI